MGVARAAMWHLAVEEGFAPISIEAAHLAELENLPVVARHRDPYDRLILAQAKAEVAT